jgi:DNA-binding NtrC family response regulator
LAVTEIVPDMVVFDDDAASAELVGKVLCQAGFHVAQAISAEVLFEYVKRNPLRAVVVARILNDTSGLEVMARVRALSPSTAVVLLSNRSEPFSVEESRPEAVLEKPFASLQSIEAAVREALEMKAKHPNANLVERVTGVMSDAISAFVPRRRS